MVVVVLSSLRDDNSISFLKEHSSVSPNPRTHFNKEAILTSPVPSGHSYLFWHVLTFRLQSCRAVGCILLFSDFCSQSLGQGSGVIDHGKLLRNLHHFLLTDASISLALALHSLALCSCGFSGKMGTHSKVIPAHGSTQHIRLIIGKKIKVWRPHMSLEWILQCALSPLQWDYKER